MSHASRHLKLNARYYIDKQIVPALDRVFSLIGVEVKNWCVICLHTTSVSCRASVHRYTEMPRSLLVNKSHQLETMAPILPPHSTAGIATASSTSEGILRQGTAVPHGRTSRYALLLRCRMPKVTAHHHHQDHDRSVLPDQEVRSVRQSHKERHGIPFARLYRGWPKLTSPPQSSVARARGTSKAPTLS